jgi:exodeoxyribonuclease-3
MKIATWNVNSVLARIPHLTRWLDAVQPDVVCLQETKCTDDKFPLDVLREHGYGCVTFGQQSYNGVAILSRGECELSQRGYPGIEEASHARLLSGRFSGVEVVNVYIPNGQSVGSEKYEFKLDWMKRLRSFFEDRYQNTNPVLLCGDFNVAPEDRDVHNPQLWQERIMCSRAEREELAAIKAWGFDDCFRKHHEEAGKFSWWDYRAGAFRRNNGLRIDHIWATPSLAARNQNSWIDIEPRTWERPSDHAPVVAEFDF